MTESLTIDQIDMYFMSQTLKNPFTTSFGTMHDRPCVILAVHANGLTGWGESVASNAPDYSYETAWTSQHIIKDFLVPYVLGKSFTDPAAFEAELSTFIRGHEMAKAGFSQAIWDLAAQRDGVSLATKLNEPYDTDARERVKVGVSIGIQSDYDKMVEVIGGYQAQGYRRIKLKIKPGRDIDAAVIARHNFPQIPIMLDANSAYTLDEGEQLFPQMDDLNLLMIEQPLAYYDIYQHSKLAFLVNTPLCLDESIKNADDAKMAGELEACGIINIKPGRVGGLGMARRIHDVAQSWNMDVWCGGMLETGIGRAAQLAIASLPGFVLPGDISATDRYFDQDITEHFELNTEDSTITVPNKAGLGVTVNEKLLKERTSQFDSFK